MKVLPPTIDLFYTMFAENLLMRIISSLMRANERPHG